MALGKVAGWGKKIWNWFHYSKMGMGHSESLAIGGDSYWTLPQETRYEARWWNRGFHIDGNYAGDPVDKKDAFECAKTYADSTSIGGLHQLRQFLEVSMQKTNNPNEYLHMFIKGFLNKVGGDKFFPQLAGIKKLSQKLPSGDPLWKSITRLMLGFTRKRELLVPEWADDTKLWVPKKEIILG